MYIYICVYIIVLRIVSYFVCVYIYIYIYIHGIPGALYSCAGLPSQAAG